MCPHALTDIQSVTFICRTQEGWAAGCSERCLDNCSDNQLGMIHLGHLAKISGLPADFCTLPINFSINRTENDWRYNYYFETYNPEEGDYVAPKKNSAVLKLTDLDKVFSFSLPGGDLVSVRLDEGTQCIPFWFELEQVANFQAHLSGREKLELVTFGKIRNFAKQNKIRYLAANFLLNSYDIALLA
jgi:hypothetical protein